MEMIGLPVYLITEQAPSCTCAAALDCRHGSWIFWPCRSLDSCPLQPLQQEALVKEGASKGYGKLYAVFGGGLDGLRACAAGPILICALMTARLPAQGRKQEHSRRLSQEPSLIPSRKQC